MRHLRNLAARNRDRARSAAIRNADPLAQLRAVSRGMKLDGSQQVELGVAYWMAFSNLVAGDGTQEAWNTVACAVNISVLLTELGICADEINSLHEAQRALLRARERGAKTGRFRLDGDGLNFVRHAMHVHDVQVAAATQGQIKQVLATLKDRIQNGQVLRDAEIVPNAKEAA